MVVAAEGADECELDCIEMVEVLGETVNKSSSAECVIWAAGGCWSATKPKMAGSRRDFEAPAAAAADASASVAERLDFFELVPDSLECRAMAK